MEADHAVLAQGSMETMRAVRRALRERGLEAELVAPPEGRGSS